MSTGSWAEGAPQDRTRPVHTPPSVYAGRSLPLPCACVGTRTGPSGAPKGSSQAPVTASLNTPTLPSLKSTHSSVPCHCPNPGHAPQPHANPLLRTHGSPCPYTANKPLESQTLFLEWVHFLRGCGGAWVSGVGYRFPEKGRGYLLLQLPGLLPPEQHLVPGFLVGVCHQRVSVVGPQLREGQHQGSAGPGRLCSWRGGGSAGGRASPGVGAEGHGQGCRGEGLKGSCTLGVGLGSRPSPAAWSSASCSSGFCGSPPPCPWTVLAGCARKAGTWGGCSWGNRASVRSPRFLGSWCLPGLARRKSP